MSDENKRKKPKMKALRVEVAYEGGDTSFWKRTAPLSNVLGFLLGNFVMLACFFFALSSCIDEGRMGPIEGLFTILISSTLVLISIYVIVLIIRPHFKFENQTSEMIRRIMKDWYTMEKDDDFWKYYNSSPDAKETIHEKQGAIFVIFYSVMGFFVGIIGYLICSIPNVGESPLFIISMVFMVTLLPIEFLFYSIFKLIIET